MSAKFPAIVASVAVFGGVGALLYHSVYRVKPGHRAILFDRLDGVQSSVYGEGFHLFNPVRQWPVIFDIRPTPRVISIVTGTKDLQALKLSLRVLSQPVVEKLPWIYQNVGTEYVDKILPALGGEVLKFVAASYTADELLQRKEQIAVEVCDQLASKCKKYSVSVALDSAPLEVQNSF